MKTTHNDKVALAHGTKASDLRAWIESVPGDATISVHVSKGDRPWESDSTTLTATWTTDTEAAS